MRSRSCFVHIPKCGGSAVISALKSALPGEFFHANVGCHQRAPLPLLLERYPVIAGHFTFAQIPEAVLNDTFVFGFLREPVDRVLSLYYFYRAQNARAGLDGRVSLAQTFDLPSLVARLPDRVGPWSNWQTFVLSGAKDCERPATELLPDALRNLERMSLVGIQDDLDEGINRLGRLRGWPLGGITRVNVTERPPLHVIDRSLVQRLRELNSCDAELFARARQLWQACKALPIDVGEARDGPNQVDQKRPSEYGTQEIVLTGADVLAASGNDARVIYQDERVAIRLRGRSHIRATDVTIGIRVTDELGIEIYGVNTRLLDLAIALDAGQEFELTFSLDTRLAAGRYFLTAAVHADEDHLHRCYHWIDNVATFECQWRGRAGFSGVVDLRATASLQ